MLMVTVVVATYIDALSRFLSHLGPQYLPLVLISVAFVMILNSFAGSALSEKFPPNKIFFGIIFFFFINYAVLFLAFSDGSTAHTAYFMVIAAIMVYMEEILINYLSTSLLTPLQEKSYLPFIYAMINAGVIAGALLAVPFQSIQGKVGTGLIQMIGLGLVMALVYTISRVLRREIAANYANMNIQPVLVSLKQSFQFVFKESSLFRALALLIFLVVGIQLAVEFKLKTVLSFTFEERTITEVYGLIILIQSVFSWGISVLLSKRLLFRYGVSNMLIVFPLSLVLPLAAVIIFNTHHVAAAALFCVFFGSHFSYYNICTSQILSIAPRRIHESVFFMMRGILFAFAFLFFSIIFLIYTYNIRLEATINTALISVLLIALILTAFKIKQLYFRELKENLYKDDMYLKLRSIDLLAEKVSQKRGEEHLRMLLHMQGVEPVVKSATMHSLGIIGNYQTIVDLTQVLLADDSPRRKSEAINAINQIVKTASDLDNYPVTKHYLLEAYEHTLLSDVPLYVKLEVITALKYFDLEDVIQFLETNLKSPSVHIKMNAINTLATFNDRGIIPFLEPFLNSENLNLLASAIVGLWKYEEMRNVLMPRVVKLLSLQTDTSVQNALYVIGEIGAVKEKDYVVRQLDHKKPHIRTYALMTLIRLGEPARIDDMLIKMLFLARSDDMRELEFILSKYRLFPEGVKKAVIKKIQAMKEPEVRLFYDAFKRSKYVFNKEMQEIGRGVFV